MLPARERPRLVSLDASRGLTIAPIIRVNVLLWLDRRGSHPKVSWAASRGERVKVIRFHELGGPEVVRLEKTPEPRPKPGQALVRVRFSGVNFADTLFHEGLYLLQPKLPDVPGLEASGVVEALGPGPPG